MTQRRQLLAAAAGTAWLPDRSARAQNPTLRRVVIYPPAGGTRVLGRTLAQTMPSGLGMTLVVANEPGASTHIAAQKVARAAPDGRTVLQADNAVLERLLDLGMQTRPGTPEPCRAFARSEARRGAGEADHPRQRHRAGLMAERVTRARIHGRVQGVGYRAALYAQALRLGVCGWVRNRRDGTVEAVLAGDADAVQRLLAWAAQGPPAAVVDRIELQDSGGQFTGFELRPTL